ncbi:hypothetical protein M1590_00565 [Candidatus Marsarchaeota archaeon]|nr:hypothetical protein [Candidatus Marsarchaeota archaeon]
MTHTIGVIGIGHWFERLHKGMIKTDEIELIKVASASGLEKHKAQLERLKLPDFDYYRIEPGRPVPEEFFDGVDIVHISDPNEFHAAQTLQSLKKGKITITEKTYGVNREEFENVMNYIKANNLENRSYLHLHYAHKLLTLQLPDMLKRFTKEYGKILSTSTTLFEKEVDDVRMRRLWLLNPKNGGIFMDLMHPFETYYKGALAKTLELEDISALIVNQEYDRVNPTGVYAKVKIDGMFFAENAYAHIRVGMGLKTSGTKSMRFLFESGQCLDLHFIDSEVEFETENRGFWELLEGIGGKVIASESPRGPTSSDVLVNDILELCRGRNRGFTLEDLDIIYEPQWKYQKLMKSTRLITDQKEVNNFEQDGAANAFDHSS